MMVTEKLDDRRERKEVKNDEVTALAQSSGIRTIHAVKRENRGAAGYEDPKKNMRMT